MRETEVVGCHHHWSFHSGISCPFLPVSCLCCYFCAQGESSNKNCSEVYELGFPSSEYEVHWKAFPLLGKLKFAISNFTFSRRKTAVSLR